MIIGHPPADREAGAACRQIQELRLRFDQMPVEAMSGRRMPSSSRLC